MFEKLHKKSWHSILLITIIGFVGVIYAAYLGFSVHEANKHNLIMRASTIAQFFTAKDIEALQGTEDDISNPAYLQIKERLMSLHDVNSDTRFIYLNGIKDGKIFFYGDSEDVNSSDYSPPGQQYDEASKLMLNLFETKRSGFEIAPDRWGVWASAFVPIIDPSTGEMVAMLGVDVSANEYLWDIAAYSLSALLLVALLIVIFLGQKRFINKINEDKAVLEENNAKLLELNEAMKATHKELEMKNFELRGLNETMHSTQKELEKKNIELMGANKDMRTAQELLEKKNSELAQLNDVMIGRELKMAQLKKELKEASDGAESGFKKAGE